jgi:predicted nucleic acid-binding protein
MGQIALPATGLIYVDTQILIYSVERHPQFARALQPLWDAVQSKRARVVTSKLSILECLVVPLRTGDTDVTNRFNTLFASEALQMEEVSEEVLRYAAKLRADTPSLRGPDSIHAATAFLCRADSFLTNDRVFDKLALPGLTQLSRVSFEVQ